MKLHKALSVFIASLAYISAAFSAENHFKLIVNKPLPNQLGVFREIEFNREDNQTATLYAAILNQNYHAKLYLHESQSQFFADYLDTLSLHNNFIIGINGGFYQPDFTPVGLFTAQGKKIKSLIHSSLLKGCVIINNDKKIELETDLSSCKKATNAMQTGPLLIQNGKINRSSLDALKEKSDSMKDFFGPHKRTLLALTNDNQIIIITTSPLTLIDLAHFLQNYPDAFGITQIKTAVNLDGGSSTGMYIRFQDEPFYLHEIKHVKTFIFIN